MLNGLFDKFTVYSKMNGEELKKALANIKTSQLNLQKIGQNIGYEEEMDAMIILSLMFSIDTDIGEIIGTKREIEKIAKEQSEYL